MTQEVLTDQRSDWGMVAIFLLNLVGFAVLQNIAEVTRADVAAIRKEIRDLRIIVENKLI